MQKRTYLVWFVFIGILLMFPVFVKAPYILHIAIMIFMFTTLGVSWNILSGFAGQISLGQSVFLGLGGYTSAILLVKFGINPWFGILAGIIISMVFGWLIGVPCFRLEGRYFAVSTMAVVQIVYLVIARWEFTGGARGIYFPLRNWGLKAFTFRTKEPYYYIVMSMMLVAMAIVYYIEYSHIGYYLKTIRENPDVARALGICVPKYKMIAMLFSAFLAAMIGTFYGQYLLFIDPDTMFLLSVPIMLVTIMGGVGSLLGPLIGAGVLISLQETARIYWSGSGRAIDQLIYGILIIIIVIVQPKGIMGMVDSLTYKLKKNKGFK
ncbi:MAG: branched-chain amino acid ABC transporter permease [Candidatus Atribacteria bacterium]|nr:branched-chain amino acid ABC transporter permease [Candidatus Atribacteria bacterium]